MPPVRRKDRGLYPAPPASERRYELGRHGIPQLGLVRGPAESGGPPPGWGPLQPRDAVVPPGTPLARNGRARRSPRRFQEHGSPEAPEPGEGPGVPGRQAAPRAPRAPAPLPRRFAAGHLRRVQPHAGGVLTQRHDRADGPARGPARTLRDQPVGGAAVATRGAGLQLHPQPLPTAVPLRGGQ